MGHRANLVLVDGEGYRLFYCHWCAITIPSDVFWGPEFAIPFIKKQPEEEKGSVWLDDVWAEGGVLANTERRYLLLWGGQLYDIPVRRLYLQLLQEVWTGWQVEWAYEGILDMADYVNIPRDRVHSNFKGELRPLSLAPPEDKKDTSVVGSVVFEDGALRLFPMDDFQAFGLLERGTAVIDAAREQPGLSTLALEEWTEEFPRGGFHIDIPQKQIHFWGAQERAGLERLIPIWQGWKVVWLKDRYEDHLSLTRGQLKFPSRSTKELLSEIEPMLTYTTRFNGPAVMAQFMGEERKKGHEVQVSASVLRDDSQNLPLELRRKILDNAILSWQRKSVQ